MSAALSVVSHPPHEDVREIERDLARAKGQLLGVIGASQVAAIANHDFRHEVRSALLEGRLTADLFDELADALDDNLESLSAAGEAMLDEGLRAVLP